MDTANMIALVSVTIAGIGTVLGMLRFVTSTAEALRKECAELLKEGIKAEAHSRGNALQPVHTWLQRIETDVSELQREGVRRSDLAAFDGRMTRMETKFDALGDKLETKFDALFRRIDGR